jgi:hypothetical protein
MGAIGSKLRSAADNQLLFWCPGCDSVHAVRVDPIGSMGNGWGWNRDGDAPTFTPSVLVNGTRRLTDDEHARLMAGEKIEPTPLVCHSFVKDGQIQFLGDCTHALAGQTVPLPDFDATSPYAT